LTFYIKKDLSSICPFSTQPDLYLSNGQTVVHCLLLVVVKIAYNFEDSLNHAIAWTRRYVTFDANM